MALHSLQRLAERCFELVHLHPLPSVLLLGAAYKDQDFCSSFKIYAITPAPRMAWTGASLGSYAERASCFLLGPGCEVQALPMGAWRLQESQPSSAVGGRHVRTQSHPMRSFPAQALPTLLWLTSNTGVDTNSLHSKSFCSARVSAFEQTRWRKDALLIRLWEPVTDAALQRRCTASSYRYASHARPPWPRKPHQFRMTCSLVFPTSERYRDPRW